MTTCDQFPYVIIEHDMAIAAIAVGGQQVVRKYELGRNGDHGGRSRRTFKTRIADGIDGIMAEMALAKYLGLPWSSGGMQVSSVDVTELIQARATDWSSGHLQVYKKDQDRAWMWLVIESYPRFSFAGFITAEEARRVGTYRTDCDPPCWWVKQSDLTPASEWHTHSESGLHDREDSHASA